MKKKLALAGALIHEPDTLLLDEPTSGLDPKTVRILKDVILEESRRGAAVLLSTHVLGVAQEVATRIAVIHKGSIVLSGTADETLQRAGEQGLESLFLELTRETEDAP